MSDAGKMSLSGKVVLITGAAGGIGAATARHFARLGAKVSMVDLNEKLLKEVGEEISKAGLSKPLAIVADVTKEAERIINETVKHFGQLDVLVNNAGVLKNDSVVDFDVDQYDRVMNINLKSMIVLTNLAVKHLEKTKGNIVNTASVAGLFASSTILSYHISKAGVNQFTKCAAMTLAPKGIRVNAVTPGGIRTPILESGLKSKIHIDDFKRHQLVEETGEPSDVARGIVYLASEPFVNGILLPIDGGFLCKRH